MAETHAVARRPLSALLSFATAAYPLALIVIAWEIVARLGLVRPLFLPTVGATIAQFFTLLASDEIVTPMLVSLYRATAGLAIAVVIGVAIGLLMARLKWANWSFDPLVSLAFPAPKIAFVPIFILWFGIDDLSKILLVAFTCVFPIIIATHHGASAVGRTIIWSAEAMNTPERKLLLRVILPAAMPSIYSGVRVSLPVALITAFTTEMVAGGGGAGAALMFAQRFFQTPTVFVYILLMLATGFVLDRVMLRARAWLIPWQPEDEGA